MATYRFEQPIALAFIDKMLKALSERPMTRAEMQTALFASKSKALSYIKFLLGGEGQEKRIYICGYEERASGGRNPRYAVGNKKDAIPPGRKTNSERFARRRADPERYKRHLAKLRAAAAAKRSREKPVTWFAALPGAKAISTTKEAA